MNMQAYIDEIKLDVTGGILELEIDDATIMKIVNSAMRELRRYICSTKLLTLPYSKCIDLSEYKVNSVARVYKTDGIDVSGSGNTADPVQLGLFQLTSNTGNMYNFNDYVYRYASWNTLQQVANTTSTDLAFYYEDSVSKLYINTTLDSTSKITIEYVPHYENVEDITSDFWIDILMKLSKALTKITLGRIRGRFTQSNALWQSDATQMLQDGQNELNAIREHLQKNTQLLYPLD